MPGVIIAKTPSEARKHGRRIEKSLQSSRLTSPSIRNHYLDDSQLLAAFAIARGDITIRDDEEYNHGPAPTVGDWGDDQTDDDNNIIRASFADAFGLLEDTTSRVAWAYLTRSNRKYLASDEDPIPESTARCSCDGGVCR